MSFLIDPPWLYAIGRTTTSQVADERTGKALAAATMGVFYGVSVGLYLNQRWTKPIWWLCRADDGRDWMLNSGVLRPDHRDAGAATHALSAALFASYPLWLWLGWRRGRR